MNFKAIALCLAATLPTLAVAQEAHSTKWVNLRAGPAQDYPLVARLGPGTPLAVQGCTDGFGWCDVVGPGDVRGWVYAGNIAYPYQSADVPVLGYGPMIGFPVVTFVIGDYWGRYYRGRPWYANQRPWINHRPPPRPIVRPLPPPRPIVRPPPRPFPPGVRPPGARPPSDHRPPPGAGGGGGRPPGAGGGRPPGAGEGGGRPPGVGAGGGRPPGGGAGAGRPGRPDGGGRPDNGRPQPR